jgi:restriction system protein
MIEEEPGKDWRDLQQRVATILQECGLDSETERTLHLSRGTAVIDVYASDPSATPPGIYLSECKRWRSRVPQAEVQAFRTVVADAGAHFGLFISASGFQSGAFEVVKHTNVHLLDWQEFQKLFLERWCRRYWIPISGNTVID